MKVDLVRECLRDAFKAEGKSAHSGLLLQRGYPEDSGAQNDAKSRHIRRVCEAFDEKFHERAYQRWCRHTPDTSGFHSFELALKSRLLIGLNGGGILETGCTISHTYGAPCLPGSSIKGVVAAYARERLGQAGEDLVAEVFGAQSDKEGVNDKAGLIAFHDAWWVPESAEKPLVPEIVTSHHPGYYSSDGEKPATDFDSPVPNAQIGVQGAFRFTLAGPSEWLCLAREMSVSALRERGIGARTRSGYGYFSERTPEPSLHPWVKEKIERIRKAPGMAQEKKEDILRGKSLAEAWQEITDPGTQEEAFQSIRAYWQHKGWWDDPPRGKSSKRAKEIYAGYDAKP